MENADILLNGINNIYEENAKLSSALRDERHKNQVLMLQVNELNLRLKMYERPDKGNDPDYEHQR